MLSGGDKADHHYSLTRVEPHLQPQDSQPRRRPLSLVPHTHAGNGYAGARLHMRAATRLPAEKHGRIAPQTPKPMPCPAPQRLRPSRA